MQERRKSSIQRVPSQQLKLRCSGKADLCIMQEKSRRKDGRGWRSWNSLNWFGDYAASFRLAGDDEVGTRWRAMLQSKLSWA